MAANFRLSLAEAEPGEALEVVAILFGSIRLQCEAWGIRAGTRVRVVERSPEATHLELEDGRPAEVEAPYAPFVEVKLLPRNEAPRNRARVDPGPESGPIVLSTLYDRTQTLP